MIRRCVFVGDMHVGSSMGMWLKVVREDETVLDPNPAQL